VQPVAVKQAQKEDNEPARASATCLSKSHGTNRRSHRGEVARVDPSKYGEKAMTDLQADVIRMSEKAVAMAQERTGEAPDYSEESLNTIEETLEEASQHVASLTEDEIHGLVQRLGCYVLEVARRSFGGTYHWYEQRSQPVLVVGEPQFHVAIIAWDKVRGRLNGDPADNIPFFYQGFAQRVRSATPGVRAVYV
jgi:hypothetical protein